MPRLDRLQAVLRVSPAALVALGLSGAAVVTQGQPVLADAVFPRQIALHVDIAGAQLSDAPAALPLPVRRLAFGVYDPSAAFSNVDLTSSSAISIRPTLLASPRPSRTCRTRGLSLITLEPWPTVESSDPSGLQDVVDGNADASLRTIAEIAATHQPQTVLLRWGHEMELARCGMPCCRERTRRTSTPGRRAWRSFIDRCCCALLTR
jgi:hypothetical protein